MSSPHSGSYGFATSYNLSRRMQEIDLLELGFAAEDLDEAPDIHIAEWFKEIYDGGDVYQMLIELRDESGETLDEFSIVELTTGAIGYADDEWFEVTHTFSGYGPGLRHIYFEDGGQDSEWWAGFYGPRLDDASVIIGDPLETGTGTDTGSVEK
jgi:F-box protein 44